MHCVGIDGLRDQSAASAWLAARESIEVVSRDRAGAYAEAARSGASAAVQVADRFHLHRNLTDVLERVLAAKRAAYAPAIEKWRHLYDASSWFWPIPMQSIRASS